MAAPPQTLATNRDEIWGREQTRRFLNISLSKLDHDRLAGMGPPFIRIGRAIRYRRSDVEAWLEAHRIGGEGK